MAFAPCGLYDHHMKATLRNLVMCLFLVSATGACIDTNASLHELPADGESLPILNQVSRVHSHETRAMQLVVRDAATYAKVPLESIDVDFEREMLLIVTLGRVPSDQYRVHINRVFREKGVLKVESFVEQPPPGAPLAPASPYCIAVVPQCELNVDRFSPIPPDRQRTWSQSEPGLGG